MSLVIAGFSICFVVPNGASEYIQYTPMSIQMTRAKAPLLTCDPSGLNPIGLMLGSAIVTSP